MYVASTHSGRLYAMGFHRRGLNGAQPSFRIAAGHMRKADELAKFEVGDGKATGFKHAEADGSVYRYDIRGMDNPIARAVEEIPALVSGARSSADLLARYASFIREHVGADDLEMHPYIPEIEAVAQDLCAILARIDGEG